MASIAPWNYPIMMAGWKIGPAFMAGNTVILKPSARTPLTALILRTSPPTSCRQACSTSSPGRAPHRRLARGHPKVGMISVTGDTETGKHIAKIAADMVKRLHLELGGKAPVIVFDDADVDRHRQPQDLLVLERRPGLHGAVPGHHRPEVYDRFVADLAGAVKTSSGAIRPRATTSRWARSSPPAQADKVEGMVDRATEVRAPRS